MLDEFFVVVAVVATLLVPIVLIGAPIHWVRHNRRERRLQARLERLERVAHELPERADGRLAALEARIGWLEERLAAATPEAGAGPAAEGSAAPGAVPDAGPASEAAARRPAAAGLDVPQPAAPAPPAGARVDAGGVAPPGPAPAVPAAARALPSPAGDARAAPAPKPPAGAPPMPEAIDGAPEPAPGRTSESAPAVEPEPVPGWGPPSGGVEWDWPTAPWRRKAVAPSSAAGSRKAPTPPATAGPEPVSGRAGAQARDAARAQQLSDWEGRIGRQWLNVVGIVVLVIGVVLLIGYSLRYLGPIGRIGTGVLTALTLLGSGRALEPRDAYRALGRSLLGGGWALLYFTAYAAHNVDAARIIDDPRWAMAAPLAVAAGMVVHSLRYRSQSVTGLAYGLAFLGIAISPVSAFSLLAVALLAGSMMTVLRTQPWYHLGLGGVIGSHICHALWREAVSGTDGTLDESNVLLGLALLAVYWLVFSTAAFVRRPVSREDRQAVGVLGIVNGVGFLGFGLVLVRVPGDAATLHAFLLLSALAFGGLAWLLRRVGLHFAFLLHALAAVVLAASSVPSLLRARDIDYDWLALPWALESALVLAIGLAARELLLRVASYALAGLAAAALFAVTLQGDAAGRQPVIWLSVPLVIAYFFYAFELLKARAGTGDVLLQARAVGLVLGYVATALLAALAWVETPRAWVAVAWIAAAVVMFEIGVRAERPHVRIQGAALAAAAAAAVLLLDIAGHGVVVPPRGASLWLLVVVCALGQHLIPERARHARGSLPGRAGSLDWLLAVASGYLGSALLAALLWREVEAQWVGAAWIVLAVVLVELGRATGRPHLRTQGLLVAALATGALVLVNVYAQLGAAQSGLVRWLTVGGSALALHWLSERAAGPGQAGVAGHRLVRGLADGASHAGTLLLALLAWVELDAVSVAVAWALLALVLHEIAHGVGRPRLMTQSRLLAIAGFARLFLANFTALGAVGGVSHRLVSVLPVTAILYYLWWCARMRSLAPGRTRYDTLDRSMYAFFGVVSLAVLARFELGRADTVIAWSVLGLAVLVLAVRLAERDFRMQSYGLLALAFARSWSTNLTLTGTVFGVSQRSLTTGFVVTGLVAATGYCMKHRAVFESFASRGGWLGTLDANARVVFSGMAAVLLALLLAYEVAARWLTVAWTIEAFALLALGFVLVERCLRLYGLGLALLCLVKLVVLDMSGVETLYRILSYIVLGVILLLVSLGYSRYQHVLRRYL